MTRVLIVEDEPDIRGVMADALTEEGYDVDCAEDGVVALDLAAAHPPDVAVVDLMMPNLDGYGFVREVRADPRHAAMQIIVITAGRASHLENLDAVALITKPFDLDELIATVTRLAAI